ncbi:MAG: helix-turn-helix transcriptional regulator [Verrucomicrobiota bacterium]|nr:helix-turn-helix transcriptional regulator [Verrucomicrobiota bacterium]
MTTQQAKKHLKANGWTYKKAALVLGVHYMHLSMVLNGRRISHSLINRINNLGRGDTVSPTVNPHE